MDLQNKDAYIGERTVKYTCEDYRSEMMLVALRKKLAEEDLSTKEKARLLEEIKKLEQEMELS
jgi:hypothetical protein